MLEAPICELIHTGKNTAKLIENNFAVSPMPNQTMIKGIIATGGKERKTCNKGLKDLSMILILPVNKPIAVPIKLPINNPTKTRQILTLICKNNSPELNNSTKAESTSAGEGKRFLFIKPLVEINCHKIRNTIIGTIK